MTEPEDPGRTRPGPSPDRFEGPGEHLEADVSDEQSVSVDVSSLRQIALHALRELGMRGSLSIALVEPSTIAGLKGRYYGVHAATDVLSFAMDGPDGPEIGDVVICPSVAQRQARALGLPLEHEMRQLLVHGILHLSGLDHANAPDELFMAKRERQILRSA